MAELEGGDSNQPGEAGQEVKRCEPEAAKDNERIKENGNTKESTLENEDQIVENGNDSKKASAEEEQAKSTEEESEKKEVKASESKEQSGEGDTTEIDGKGDTTKTDGKSECLRRMLVGEDLSEDETTRSATEEQQDAVVDDKESKNTEKEVAESADEDKSDKIASKESQISSEDETKHDGYKKSEILESLLTDNDEDQSKPDEDTEMDEDFDPTLLCPEVSMAVEEQGVVTQDNNDQREDDRAISPMLYEPVFSTLVDEITGAEVQFNLTAEEEALRRQTFPENNPVQYTKIHCTACNIHLGSALDAQNNRFVHPLLKVLVCKNCYHFYTSGEFEKDEDGSELYCRWCGQGGQVLCCSNCEFVFCKKCIRNNFGRRKLTEVTHSDDWKCFRCDMGQLMKQRVICAEFFEFIQREMAKVSTLEDPKTMMSKDHTTCCLAAPKRPLDDLDENVEEKPKKKRKKPVDPDYDYARDKKMQELEREVPKPPRLLAPAPTPPVAANPPIFLPQPSTSVPGVVRLKLDSSKPPITQSFRLGNTTFKPTMFAPTSLVTTIPFTTNSQNMPAIRLAQGSSQLFQINPPILRPLRPNMPVLTPRPVQKIINPPLIKHEWFDKTVRSAARVNSNLSYTLTHLNRAQQQATNVESLAVVHNKLQEILSTSINTLIQIRKNLRTEFIQGIKNVKFPPKQTKTFTTPIITGTHTIQDDDVVCLTPPASTSKTKNVQFLPPLSPAVSLTPKSKPAAKGIPDPITSLSKNSKSGQPDGQPRVYLKVKSFSALQNVTSDCITIPDSPALSIKETIPIETVKLDVPLTDKSNEIKLNGEVSLHRRTSASTTSSSTIKSDLWWRSFKYDVTKPPDEEVKKMLAVVINVERSEKINELLKSVSA